MPAPIRILIVEDEMLIAAKISLQLTKMGYEVMGILPRGEDALMQCRESAPDILLLDINLKGKWDGVQTAREIQKEQDIPIIYVTANADDDNFNRAKSTKPQAFISKPFKKLDLQRAVELVANRMVEVATDSKDQDHQPFLLSDRIFVRHKDAMVKIILSDIFYLEADRSYCKIYTADTEYLLSVPLKSLEDKLPPKHFLRIHRSFVINLLQIDKVGEGHVVIADKAIPISRSHREEFLRRIPFI